MKICPQYPLLAHNTLGIAAFAERWVSITSLEQLQQTLAVVQGAPLTVLGGGSNVVLRSDLPGWVLHMAIAGREWLDEDSDAWYLRVGAGENWHQLVRWTLAQNRPGLENLSLIPGTAGAAPIQNIGAYGLELKSVLHEVEAVEIASGRKQRFSNADCEFGYRDSIFKRQAAGHDAQAARRYIITHITLRLPKCWQPNLQYRELAQALQTQGLNPDLNIAAPVAATPSAQQISDTVIALRQSKLPDWRTLGNVGSFFKNPVVSGDVLKKLLAQYPDLPHYPLERATVTNRQQDQQQNDHQQNSGGPENHAPPLPSGAKLAAGWLIEQAGWKGKRLGAAGVYEKQALVLVNHGGASGSDILALASAVQTAVQQKFGVTLEREPVVLPA